MNVTSTNLTSSAPSDRYSVSKMSYAYLFKYIIIGDTGNYAIKKHILYSQCITISSIGEGNQKYHYSTDTILIGFIVKMAAIKRKSNVLLGAII